MSKNGIDVIVGGLQDFYQSVLPGDEVLITRSRGTVYGVYVGPTSGLNNVNQHIELDQAFVLPTSINIEVPESALNFMANNSLGLKKDHETFNLGRNPFTVIRRRPNLPATSL